MTGMPRRSPGTGHSRVTRRGAFSLVEVVVAVGVFVAGVIGALVLLSTTTDQVGQTRAVLTATRISESTIAWLRTRSAAEIADAVEAGNDGAYWADHDGLRFSWHEAIAIEDAYFLLTVEKADASAEVTADDETLGVHHRLRVSWPVWQTAGERAGGNHQDSVTFNFLVPR